MGENILELRGVAKRYHGFELQSLNLELPCGCIMGLIGENGAGKSTTLKAILGLVHPDEGEVILFGKNSGAGGGKDSLKEEIGVVLGELSLPSTFNGREICRMMEGIYRRWNSAQFYGYLEQFGIDGKKRIKDYSRGMKMKAALAIALSHDAKLLLLDEPTSGLDPVVREEVLELMREFVMDEKRAVLISSHIISDLEKTADYVAFLHQGRLVLCEEKDRILEEYRLLKGDREEILRQKEAGAVEILGLREHSFGAEALVREHGFRPGKSGLVLEPVNLEEIMLHLIRGEGGEKG